MARFFRVYTNRPGRPAVAVTLASESAARAYASKEARLCVAADSPAAASRLASCYGAARDAGEDWAAVMRGPGRTVPVIYDRQAGEQSRPLT